MVQRNRNMEAGPHPNVANGLATLVETVSSFKDIKQGIIACVKSPFPFPSQKIKEST